jgi:transposase
LRRWRTSQKRGQAAQALGRSRGGFTTKIHLKVEALGNPLTLRLTPGQQHDITQAPALLGESECEHVIADMSYDAQDFRDLIESKGATAVIPSRKNRKQPFDHDAHLYKERHLVECCINKFKHYRRIFSRFDKLDSRYLGFLSFAATLIWLR